MLEICKRPTHQNILTAQGPYKSKNSDNMLHHQMQFNKIHIHLLHSTTATQIIYTPATFFQQSQKSTQKPTQHPGVRTTTHTYILQTPSPHTQTNTHTRPGSSQGWPPHGLSSRRSQGWHHHSDWPGQLGSSRVEGSGPTWGSGNACGIPSLQQQWSDKRGKHATQTPVTSILPYQWDSTTVKWKRD